MARARKAASETPAPTTTPPQNGWRRVRFGDVVRDVMVRVDPETSGLERYIAGEHLGSNDMRVRSWGTIGDGYLGPAFYRKFVKGQVLYLSRRPYLRKMGRPDFDGVCGEKTFVLEPKGPDLIPGLLPYILQAEAFTEHAVSKSIGSVNPHVRFRDLADYEFWLPADVLEQRRIVDVLSAADDAVEAWRIARDTAGQTDKGAFGGLLSQFTGDGAEFVEMRISHAGEVQLGRQRSPAYETGRYTRPYLRVANVFDGYLDLSDVLSMDFDTGDYSRFRLADGDILLNEGQSRDLVGRSCIYRGEIDGCCFQNTLIRFRPGPGVFPEYAQAYFRWMFHRGDFAKIASQTTSIAHLGVERFARLVIRVPDVEVQQQIVSRLKLIETVRTQASERFEHTERLFRKLLPHLLTPPN